MCPHVNLQQIDALCVPALMSPPQIVDDKSRYNTPLLFFQLEAKQLFLVLQDLLHFLHLLITFLDNKARNR